MDRKQFLTALRSRMPTGNNPTVYVDDRVQRTLSRDDCLSLFVERATAALSKVYLCTAIEEALPLLESIIGTDSFVDTGCKQFASTIHRLNSRAKQRLQSTDNVMFGISEATFGVALTGSCVLDASQHRGGTLLPPRHIILIDSSKIVEDLHKAYSCVADSLKIQRTSVFAFHTGPSRSADIEQTMALGVHGPGDVHIVVFAVQPSE